MLIVLRMLDRGVVFPPIGPYGEPCEQVEPLYDECLVEHNPDVEGGFVLTAKGKRVLRESAGLVNYDVLNQKEISNEEEVS